METRVCSHLIKSFQLHKDPSIISTGNKMVIPFWLKYIAFLNQFLIKVYRFLESIFKLHLPWIAVSVSFIDFTIVQVCIYFGDPRLRIYNLTFTSSTRNMFLQCYYFSYTLALIFFYYRTQILPLSSSFKHMKCFWNWY